MARLQRVIAANEAASAATNAVIAVTVPEAASAATSSMISVTVPEAAAETHARWARFEREIAEHEAVRTALTKSIVDGEVASHQSTRRRGRRRMQNSNASYLGLWLLHAHCAPRSRRPRAATSTAPRSDSTRSGNLAREARGPTPRSSSSAAAPSPSCSTSIASTAAGRAAQQEHLKAPRGQERVAVRHEYQVRCRRVHNRYAALVMEGHVRLSALARQRSGNGAPGSLKGVFKRCSTRSAASLAPLTGTTAEERGRIGPFTSPRGPCSSTT